jgi:uncharacterized protein
VKKESTRKIAVIGGGVAGIVTAYLLQRKFEVSLFEKNDYIGGHTHTVVLEDGPDAGTAVDTGFIVFNEKTYPNFIRFLAQLKVEKLKSSMSFSYYDVRTGMAYASTSVDTFLAQRMNIFKPSFWMMALAILRFNHITPKHLEEGKLKGLTLGEFLAGHRFNRHFVEQYLIPICASVWSAPDVRMLEFPMETFARFFLNHGLLSIVNQPQWYVVKGGSHAYVKAFLKTFRGRVFSRTPVTSITRGGNGISLKTSDGAEDAFDAVIVACHADEALRMLADPSPDERRLLGAWDYSHNRTILHHDTSFLPPFPKVWASWNYMRMESVESGSPVMLTYYMNRLQGLAAQQQYCVTLNPKKPVPPDAVIREMVYNHPVYTPESLATQAGIAEINARQNTYFCGSYLGNGFHEDAVKSAVAVARSFGIEL